MADRTGRRLAGGGFTGFTLIELLIVVMIIALLATLVIPSVQRAAAMARAGSCRNNLRAVAVSIRMYLNKSPGNIMPRAAQMPSLGLNDEPSIVDALGGDIEDPEILQCPSDNQPNDNGKTYFQSEGSSYEYHSMLGGKKVGDNFLSRNYGESNTPVMNDYKPFHGRPGESGAMNYLFADCSVGDL
ncbi:MAG: type II secretion system protein [Phycisphaerae bacterium]|jgi:prepilin-type N-terminal cleavage/methylation domain-containing protein/prepilin-type processing-associated H-X9-DG protein|nr:type II secretion system protein [Phycisphaerae bacterium]